MPRVLIVHGSKNGSTAGIAAWVGDELREVGFDVEVHPAIAHVDPSGFDAVVIGGSLYALRWPRPLRRYVRLKLARLRERPVWSFSSGPLDASADTKDIPPTHGVAMLLGRMGARSHVTFGGRLTAEAKGFMAQSMVKQGKGGDFRNPDRVRDWARSVADEIKGLPTTGSAAA